MTKIKYIFFAILLIKRNGTKNETNASFVSLNIKRYAVQITTSNFTKKKKKKKEEEKKTFAV